MSHSAFFEAAERVVEFYGELEAQLDVELPPQNVLSEREQVETYLYVISQPQLARAFENLKGSETYRDWVLTMEHKAKLLGLAEAQTQEDTGRLGDDMDDMLAAQVAEIERGE